VAIRKEITGKRFGRLVVVSFSRANGKRYFWNCICDCGNKKEVDRDKLTQGDTSSCGCYKSEQISKRRKIHGMSGSRFYGVWNDMMMRCYNENKERYPNYGGRGIAVCKRWHTFNNFYLDMFCSYKKGLSLERKKVNKNYCKSNCCWILTKLQKLNKTNTILLIIDGVKKRVPEWMEISPYSESTVYSRIRNGWSHKEAVFGKK